MATNSYDILKTALSLEGIELRSGEHPGYLEFRLSEPIANLPAGKFIQYDEAWTGRILRCHVSLNHGEFSERCWKDCLAYHASCADREAEAS